MNLKPKIGIKVQSDKFRKLFPTLKYALSKLFVLN